MIENSSTALKAGNDYSPINPVLLKTDWFAVGFFYSLLNGGTADVLINYCYLREIYSWQIRCLIKGTNEIFYKNSQGKNTMLNNSKLSQLLIAIATIFSLFWLNSALAASVALPYVQIDINGTSSYLKEFSPGTDGVSGRYVDTLALNSCDGSVFIGTQTCDGSVTPSPAGTLSFDGSFDYDPFITYSLSALNNSNSPINFVITFFSPYVGGPYNTLFSEVKSNDGVENLVAQSVIDAVITDTLTCSSYPCNINNTKTNLMTLASGMFMVESSFTLPIRGSANITGKIELLNQTPNGNVPEPASLALLGLGFAGMRLTRRKAY